MKPSVTEPLAPFAFDERVRDMFVSAPVVSCGYDSDPEMVSSTERLAALVDSASSTPTVPVVALDGRVMPLSVTVRTLPLAGV